MTDSEWTCHVCSIDDFRNFANTLEGVKDKGIIVAVASSDDISTANQERPGLLELKKVL